MFSAMNKLHLLLIAILLGGGAGCSQTPHSPGLPPVHDRAPATAPLADADRSSLSATALDSLTAEETDWLIDSLAVLVDPLSLPGDLGSEIPDISDSLAAATEARMPSVEELFDYPVVVNRRVLTWIDLYLGRAKGSFERSLRRSGRYLAMSRRIFAEEGVPQDLVFLAHVESGFRYNARSHAKALGLWQFMRGTARIYDLRCDSYVDERLDPEKETRACAQHLHDLYEEFGDWYLALAAYNVGSGRVHRAIRRAGTRDFWRIAQTRFLCNETRNFVPAILAATILAKSPGAYGLNEETDSPLVYDTVAVDSPTDLRVVARLIDVTLAELQRLNPALLLLQTPQGIARYDVRVPLGYGTTFARRIAEVPPEERLVYYRHKVRRGEVLGVLARRYGTTVRAIQDANRMGRKTLIRIGQELLIPSRHSGGTDLVRYAFDDQGNIEHRVRRGETLSEIAAHYRVGVKELQLANDITDAHRISIGQRLVVPVPEEKRQAARAEAAVEAAVRSARAAEGERLQSLPGPAPSMVAHNNSETLGRVPSTAHIVEQARLDVSAEEERLRELRASAPAPQTYAVRRGDTLSEIAARFGVGVRDLRRWNDLRSGHLIFPGQKLWVRDPVGERPSGQPRQVYVVERGDSLWKIAQQYGVSTGDLARWNGLGRTATIYPGQKLMLY